MKESVGEAAGISGEERAARVEKALQRLRDRHAPMRIPADPSDPDLVIADLNAELDRVTAERDYFQYAPPLDGNAKSKLALEQERDAAIARAEKAEQCNLYLERQRLDAATERDTLRAQVKQLRRTLKRAKNKISNGFTGTHEDIAAALAATEPKEGGT